MPYLVDAEIISQSELAKKIYSISLFASKIATQAQPGQFVHLLIGKNRDYILRRPFSIHRVVTPNTIEILFKVCGRGTEELAKMKKNKLSIIGPLGQGYEIPKNGKHFLLLAGGIGLASLYFLAEKLLDKHRQFNMLYGVKNSEELLYYLELKRMSHRLTVATEDGSKGLQGQIVKYLADEIQAYHPDCIFTCGPEGMLVKVAEITSQFDIECQMSLEEKMACGVGVCFSCVSSIKDNQKSDQIKQLRTCIDGPVFRASEVVFNK